MKRSFAYKELLLRLALVGGVILFLLGVLRISQFYAKRAKWPLRVQRRLEALNKAQKEWRYETSESPLPLKDQFKK